MPYNRAVEQAISIHARHGLVLIFQGYQNLLSDRPETKGNSISDRAQHGSNKIQYLHCLFYVCDFQASRMKEHIPKIKQQLNPHVFETILN